MNAVLVDTHAFLWWALEPEKLSPAARLLLSAPETRVVLSVASAWEAEIKIGLGKLTLEGGLADLIAVEVERNRWEILPVHLNHIRHLSRLPSLHWDPFDRLLIAQALSEKLVILSKDPQIRQYEQVETTWE